MVALLRHQPISAPAAEPRTRHLRLVGGTESAERPRAAGPAADRPGLGGPSGPARRPVVATLSPALLVRFTVNGVSEGLTAEQRSAAADWIAADPDRLRSFQEQFAAIAPAKHRRAGNENDDVNLRSLAPLPFGDIVSPTLIAHGINDRIVPIDHAERAAAEITGAERILVEEGHHILTLSRQYGPVAQRQLELVHG